METESKYLKKIRDILRKKSGNSNGSIYSGPNTKAKYLNDIAKACDELELSGLPEVTSADNFKVLSVVSGKWAKAERYTYTFAATKLNGTDNHYSINSTFSEIRELVMAKYVDVILVCNGPLNTVKDKIELRFAKRIYTNVNDDKLYFSSVPVDGKAYCMVVTPQNYANVELKEYVVGATELTGTLTAGSTSLTIQDDSITTNSTIDYYTSIFGVNPTDAVVTTGQVVLTFAAQQSNMDVKVRVS